MPKGEVSMKKFDDDVREFIISQIENVELDGLCPICGTGRSQNGECWRGHIVINVRRPTTGWSRPSHSSGGGIANMPYTKPKYYIGLYNLYVRVPYWLYSRAKGSRWISTKFTRYTPLP